MIWFKPPHGQWVWHGNPWFWDGFENKGSLSYRCPTLCIAPYCGQRPLGTLCGQRKMHCLWCGQIQQLVHAHWNLHRKGCLSFGSHGPEWLQQNGDFCMLDNDSWRNALMLVQNHIALFGLHFVMLSALTVWQNSTVTQPPSLSASCADQVINGMENQGFTEFFALT